MKPSTVTVREAVRIARLTRQQIYNVVINGSVRATKTPGKRGVWQINLASLKAYLRRKE